jgi:flavodoxin
MNYSVLNTVTLYTSVHGHSREVAYQLPNPIKVIPSLKIDDFNMFIFVCPTYGDEELPLTMEEFLLEITNTNKYFTVCELGNYYGYEDFQFGSRKIISHFLQSRGWEMIFPGLSLDSMPKIDWPVFNEWKKELLAWTASYSIKS